MSRKIVIVPTYNEKENIELLIRKVMGVMSDLHILVVEDNSPDGTANIVSHLMPSFPDRLFMLQREGKQGLGTAYLAGFRWAIDRGYDYVFEMDADFSHDPGYLPDLLNACEQEGFDMSIGSRYITGVNVINWPMGRVLMSYYASAYVRLVTGMHIRDTTAGFKCYHVSVLKKIMERPVRVVGYAFQIEMKFRAWKYGFKIKEVPIIFRDRNLGQSKMSRGIFREAIFGVIGMRIRSIFLNWK